MSVIKNIINNKEVPKLFSVLVDQVFMSATTLLTAIVLARTYSKINYADLILLFSIALFTLGFQSSLLSKPYAIGLNDFNEIQKKEYFNFNFTSKVILTLGLILLFPLLYYFLFNNWDTNKVILFLFYIVAHSSYYFVRETLLSERKTKENLAYGLCCSLGLIGLLLFILISKNANIELFLIISSIIYLLVTTVYVINNFKKFMTNKGQLSFFFKSNWKVGKWLVGSNILFHISSEIYPWLLLYITTKSDIAILGVLTSISSITNPLLTALSSYLLPIFVKINFDYKRLRNSIKKWSLLFSSTAILLIIIGYFLGQDIILLFFGEKYKNLGIIVVYPFVVQSINIFFQPFKIALNAIKRTDVNFWILIPRSILTVCVGYFFVKKFGLIGVFYTKIVENLFYQLIYYIAYKKIISKKPVLNKTAKKLIVD